MDIKSKVYLQNPKANVILGVLLILIGIIPLPIIYFVWDILLVEDLMYVLIFVLFLLIIIIITGLELVVFNEEFFIKTTEEFIEIHRGFDNKKIKIAEIEDVYLGVESGVYVKTKKRVFCLSGFNSEDEMNEFVSDVKQRLNVD